MDKRHRVGMDFRDSDQGFGVPLDTFSRFSLCDPRLGGAAGFMSLPDPACSF